MPDLDLLDRVRRICLALPETSEKEAWGEPTFRVRKKLFAMYAEHHHRDGRIALGCNALLAGCGRGRRRRWKSAGHCRSRSGVSTAHSTISAVTIPNMPFGPSACGRM